MKNNYFNFWEIHSYGQRFRVVLRQPFDKFRDRSGTMNNWSGTVKTSQVLSLRFLSLSKDMSKHRGHGPLPPPAVPELVALEFCSLATNGTLERKNTENYECLFNI